MYQNFIFIDELRPPINDLRNELNAIKQKKSISDIKILQERFSQIFFDYNFDLESDDEINLTITKNKKKFKIENSS